MTAELAPPPHSLSHRVSSLLHTMAKPAAAHRPHASRRAGESHRPHKSASFAIGGGGASGVSAGGSGRKPPPRASSVVSAPAPRTFTHSGTPVAGDGSGTTPGSTPRARTKRPAPRSRPDSPPNASDPSTGIGLLDLPLAGSATPRGRSGPGGPFQAGLHRVASDLTGLGGSCSAPTGRPLLRRAGSELPSSHQASVATTGGGASGSLSGTTAAAAAATAANILLPPPPLSDHHSGALAPLQLSHLAATGDDANNGSGGDGVGLHQAGFRSPVSEPMVSGDLAAAVEAAEEEELLFMMAGELGGGAELWEAPGGGQLLPPPSTLPPPPAHTADDATAHATQFGASAGVNEGYAVQPGQEVEVDDGAPAAPDQPHASATAVAVVDKPGGPRGVQQQLGSGGGRMGGVAAGSGYPGPPAQPGHGKPAGLLNHDSSAGNSSSNTTSHVQPAGNELDGEVLLQG